MLKKNTLRGKMETIKYDLNIEDQEIENVSKSSEGEKIVLAKNTLRGKMNTIKYDENESG